MVLKIFLIGIGVFLGSSVALLVLVKQFAPGFGNFGKKPLVYGIISSIVAALIGWGITYVTENLFAVFWILGVMFLVFGIIHMLIMHRKFYGYEEQPDKKLFIAECFFAGSVLLFTLVAFSSLQYFIKDKSFLFYPMLLAALAFFIPLLVYHTFLAAVSIPDAIFHTWQYPLGRPIDPPMENENERLLVIGFEIGKKSSDGKKTYFRARGPEEIKLGELFYHFINDYNDLHSETPIQFLESEDEAYEWWFRIKPKWYQGQKVLDPFLTMKGNEIRENSVIICERIGAAV